MAFPASAESRSPSLLSLGGFASVQFRFLYTDLSATTVRAGGMAFIGVRKNAKFLPTAKRNSDQIRQMHGQGPIPTLKDLISIDQ
jgi:hypothetical protein